ncbi:hypothetical protein EYZ11_010880 [Aspergillus tanneri]|uniref:Starter acyltransferase (SAT) domain-containing protein n=1 Tax=Aspergillus tanneri TaxID=1220188 RepID=A0A4S3J479_9EURO|nr:hypothetical protein EYZ11_010880 [Aspergillus tanneri]
MDYVAVFAGLGSESLFSQVTLDTAIQDASLPESQIILQACHACFRTQIATAMRQGRLAVDAIDLDDFTEPETLLRPPPSYHQSVVLQHTTIYLVQIVRYLRQSRELSHLRGVAGFCVGVLPAAAIASTHSLVQFLQRAQDLFQVALWVGINSETYRRAQATRGNSSTSLPWSVVVDNFSDDITRPADNGRVRD